MELFLRQLDENEVRWKNEQALAAASSMPGWVTRPLCRAFENDILVPIRDAVAGGGSQSKELPGLQAAVRAILHEYLTTAPLVSPAAARARNTLAFMTSRLTQQVTGSTHTDDENENDSDEGDEKSSSSSSSSDSNAQVEAVWRDLLIDSVKHLLNVQTKYGTSCLH